MPGLNTNLDPINSFGEPLRKGLIELASRNCLMILPPENVSHSELL
jgi:hypothetical protein